MHQSCGALHSCKHGERKNALLEDLLTHVSCYKYWRKKVCWRTSGLMAKREWDLQVYVCWRERYLHCCCPAWRIDIYSVSHMLCTTIKYLSWGSEWNDPWKDREFMSDEPMMWWYESRAIQCCKSKSFGDCPKGREVERHGSFQSPAFFPQPPTPKAESENQD